MTTTQGRAGRRSKKNGVTAAFIVGVVVAMGAAAYAAVPLYYAFCRATGYNGAPRVAKQAPGTFGQRIMTVRFDTNVMPGLPWSFEPEQPFVRVRTGATTTVFFKVTNNSSHTIVGQAGYNVSPDQSAYYFNKIACFCFSTQTFGPGETKELPVLFFLDPALEKDDTMNGIDTVTLSYTFYPVKEIKTVASADAHTTVN
jgi:cytochrome c oxidase assembly protein subunit 11